MQVELSAHAHHVAVEPLFDQRAKCPNAELAREHDVERMRGGATRFITKLNVADFLASSGALLVSRLHPIGHHFGEIERAEPNVAVLISRHPEQCGFRQQLGQALRQHHGAVVLLALFALEHEVDDPIDERGDRQTLLDPFPRP